MIKFGSLFTGVGGFDLGFERAGMKCAWQVEQDKFCNEVLERHYPNVRRYEDVREVGKRNLEPVELICGGFPCQDLSVAGKRAGFDGERSSLWFEFERIIDEMRPQWAVIENVPGIFSSANGSDFGTILKSLDGFGYGVAWRVLDSQYFGVAQRRRRVFIVASLGGPRCGEVLFEQAGVSGDFEKGREKRQGAADRTTPSIVSNGDGHSGFRDEKGIVIMSSGQANAEIDSERSPALTGLHESPVIANWQSGGGKMDDDVAATLRSGAEHNSQFVWQMNHADEVHRDCGEISPTLQSRMGTGGNNVPLIGVRRLTPTECCRLQGFPDDWNDNVSDSQRYKQTGNAVTVNVIEWIGNRIIMCENNHLHKVT
ncbi:MAG: DNA cytosine methyltransferase [Chloroflexota bacterium]|nr:DNA cytosine methyltransferase [Chloroflexota bacterium]